MLNTLSHWFEQAPRPISPSRVDYVILGLIVLAGAVIRFWGLGNVGLHGDEETMAMPAMALLETGRPNLPSGMEYVRALLNVYLMAGSAFLFGESEWAFRFPSAVAGSLMPLAAFFMGRRFLMPGINSVFVATVALHPAFVEISQTARMYVFFVVCAMWFTACIFRWERDAHLMSLGAAVLVWLLAVHFHILSIFVAPLFLYPGLSQQSWKMLLQGTIAFTICAVGFYVQKEIIGDTYPESDERPTDVETSEAISIPTPLESLYDDHFLAFASVILVISIVIAWVSWRARKAGGWSPVAPVLLVGTGVLSVLMLQYHAAAILLLLGAVFWMRQPALSKAWLTGAIVFAAFAAALQLGLLYGSGLYPGRKVVGAVIGMPSIWPILRFLEYSPVAGVIFVAIFLKGLAQFSRKKPLEIHYLFFIVSVWGPLLLLGLYTWYMPPRYAIGQLPLFLLCVFAALSSALMSRTQRAAPLRAEPSALVVTAFAALLVINPMSLKEIVNPDYSVYPDHKGAAEYIRALNLDPETIVVAEDILQQTYYLGRVDYWLMEADNAFDFAFMRNGVALDQYTGTPILGSGEALEEVLLTRKDVPVYIIGSGENFVGGRRLFRGRGIAEALERPNLTTVFVGRDGKTKVWARIPENADPVNQ